MTGGGPGVSVGDGILLVDKPAGMTSHDVVARSRRLTRTRRVGHAGTLDPMATGLLVVGVNKGTKLLTYLVGCDKEYLATIRLGATTVTDDAEGERTSAADPALLRATTDAAIHSAVQLLTGDIQQVPSSVSAIKVGGQRSYARVRSGEEVTLASRPVTIHAFDVLAIRREPGEPGTSGESAERGAQAERAKQSERMLIEVDVRVQVSSGTYVRALARDLGRSLGTGGYLSRLRRTRVGDFHVDSAHSLDGLQAAVDQAAVDQAAEVEPHGQPDVARGLPLLSLAQVARRALPALEIGAAERTELRFGRGVAITAGGHAHESSRAGSVPTAAVFGDELVAIVTAVGDHYRPVTVFATS